MGVELTIATGDKAEGSLARGNGFGMRQQGNRNHFNQKDDDGSTSDGRTKHTRLHRPDFVFQRP